MRDVLLPLMSLASIALATPAAAAPPASPCSKLAADARRLSAAPVSFLRYSGTPADLFGGRVRLQPEQDHAPPEVRDAFKRILEPNGGLSFQPLEAGVWRAEDVEGTLGCSTDAYLRIGRGASERLAAPAAYGDLCASNQRSVGRVDGQPAVIETSVYQGPQLGWDVQVTPWVGRWGTACELSIRYDDEFTLTERFCDDAALCRLGEDAAPGLARTYTRETERSEGSRTKRLAAIESQFKAEALPTFGGQAKTEFADFAAASRALEVAAGGKDVVARVGIGGVGWRELGDYLVVLYRLTPAGLKPGASFVVVRRPVRVASIRVSRPKPYHDDR